MAANGIGVLYSTSERRIATSDKSSGPLGSSISLLIRDPARPEQKESFDLCSKCEGNDVDIKMLSSALIKRLSTYKVIEQTSWEVDKGDLSIPGLSGKLRWKAPRVELVQGARAALVGKIEPEKLVENSKVTPESAAFVEAEKLVVVRATKSFIAKDANGPLRYESTHDYTFRLPGE